LLSLGRPDLEYNSVKEAIAIVEAKVLRVRTGANPRAELMKTSMKSVETSIWAVNFKGEEMTRNLKFSSL